MKRLLMGFATCVLIMTSCSKQDTMEDITGGQWQLSFSAGTAQSGTKAAELNNTTLQSDSIALYAYQNISSVWNKWYNDTVVYYGGKWALKNSIRFRNSNATKYITYSSKAINGTTPALIPNVNSFTTADFTTGKFPTFEYTVAGSSVTQEDLVAGITEVAANKTDITLGMRHILSQVNFGTVGYKGADIRIQNIQIVGVGNSADFTYKAVDTYTIGEWSVPTTKTTTYDYYNYTNTAVADNPQPSVPVTATSGVKYIFGDGGNAGPGLTGVRYPNSGTGVWVTPVASSTGLSNSLMLLPQTLAAAKVTFEYKIIDVDSIYVAGSASTFEKGEFSLDFNTGSTSGTHYMGEWEQNFRYVYLIDFSDFLDGIALTFKVDVDMYEWENYNKNDGLIDVVAAAQPSAANMNAAAFVDGDTWYIASQSETNPSTPDPEKWAQVMRNEIWDLGAYDFKNIAVGQTFNLNFLNVIFNTTGTTPVATTIILTLPDGFSVIIPGVTTNITVMAHATQPNTWVISQGDKSALAAITIVNDRYYRSAAALETAIEGVTVDALKFGYSSTDAVDLVTMEPTDLTGINEITVKFNCLIVPTVGATTGGVWSWNAATQTATWTKN